MKRFLFIMMVLSLTTQSGCVTAHTTAKAEYPVDKMGNKINGKVPPMTPSKSMFETRVLEAEEGLDGKTLITSRTVREKGTRSPIHIHPNGGQTCVIAGEMTLYMDGAEPQVAPEGTCYWMPPNRRMTGVNTANSATIMLDSFVVTKGDPVWIVVEPGMESSQQQFDKTFMVNHKH